LLLASVAFTAGALAYPGLAAGQGLDDQVRPAPRTPDGGPDLSGVWGVTDRAPGIDTTAREESAFLERLYGPLVNEAPVRTPWAEERYVYNQDPRPGFGAREELKPALHCSLLLGQVFCKRRE
jgi:hypothetical protein